MNAPATKQDLHDLRHELRLATKQDTEDMRLEFKSEMKTLRQELYDDLRTLIFQILEEQAKQFEIAIERIDRHIAQNALGHNKFDQRIHSLESTAS